MAARRYPITAEVEGRKYSGHWRLMLDGRLCVSWSALREPRIVELSLGETPENVAPLVLKQMVERWLEEQRRPPPKPPKARRRVVKTERREEPADRQTLRKLVAEIAAGDYQDPKGHHLVQNTAYLEAVALLDLQDHLER
jgi:hypothetical protein